MDEVFRALSEPVRRAILDTLRARGALTVSELERELGVSRFVVIKHLRSLERALLVTSRKEGRFRRVLLNPMPIQELADRWIAPMIRPQAKRLSHLKRTLEAEEAEMTERSSFRLVTYIRTSPERLWRALTDPADTVAYYFGTKVESGWKPGDAYAYRWPDGSVMLDGEVVEADPPRRLVTTFRPHWDGDKSASNTRVVYEIKQDGETCRLTVIHEALAESEAGIRDGWSKIIAALKTWLETNKPLKTPPPGA